MKLHSYLLAGAAILTLGTFATGARADTIYTTVAPGTTVTTQSGTEQISHESYTAVGTRKVGLVGYHPYPMVASHVDKRSVQVSAPDTVVYTTNGAPIASSSTTVTTSNSNQPIAYSAGGGNYYTEDGTKYYRDPALNVRVRTTGSLND